MRRGKQTRILAFLMSTILTAGLVFSGTAYAEPLTDQTSVIEELPGNQDLTHPDLEEDNLKEEDSQIEEIAIEENGTEGTLFDNVIAANQISENQTQSGHPDVILGGYDVGFITEGIPEEDEPNVGADIPSSYRVIDRSDITRVKNQMRYGTCWTFGTLGSGEQTYINNATPLNGQPDLAEIQLAWFTNMDEGASRYGDTQGDKSYIDFGEDNLTDKEKAYFVYSVGGWKEAAIWTLARGIGAADEKVTPSLDYEQNYGTEEKAASIDRQYAYLSEAYLKNAYEVNLDSNPNLAKQMIIQYGALATGYTNDWDSFSTDERSYYYDGVAEDPDNVGGHIVTVVGWDDNYAIDNFKEGERPPHPGAWLIKNSWGSSFADNGYFWMSYDNKEIQDTYAVDMEKTDPAVRNYQYDGTSGIYTKDIPYNGTICNVFTASGTDEAGKTEVLEQVSFGVASPNLDYEIRVYKNPTDENDPSSGTLMNENPIKGHLVNSGYHTIDLPQRITLQTGDKFAVAVQFEGKRDDEKVALWIDTSYKLNLGGRPLVHVDNMKQGQSFYKNDDNSDWEDLSEENEDERFTPRLKSFTRVVDNTPATSISLNKSTLSLKGGQSETLIASILPNNATNYGLVWTSSAPKVAEVAQDGTVTGIGTGIATITVKTENGLKATCNVRVMKDITAIEAIPTKRSMKVGTTISKTDVSVYACSDSGRIKLLPEEYAITSVQIAEGKNSVTVNYGTGTVQLQAIVNITGVKEENPEADHTPRLMQKSVMVNRKLIKQGGFRIIPAEGTEAYTSISENVYQDSGLRTQMEGVKLTLLREDEYQISVADTLAQGKKKIFIKADVTMNGKTESYALPIIMQVKDKTPSVTLKVPTVNVFYCDLASRSKIIQVKTSTGTRISTIKLDEKLSDFFRVEKMPSGKFKMVYQPKVEPANAKEVINKGVAYVSVARYKQPIQVKIKIPVQEKAPQLKSSEDKVVLNLYKNTNLKKVIPFVDTKGCEQELDGVKFADESISANFTDIAIEDGYVSMTLKETSKDYFKKAKNIKLYVSSSEWAYILPVSFKFQVTDRMPSMSLGNKKITLNKEDPTAFGETFLNFNANLGQDGYTLDASCIEDISKGSVSGPVPEILKITDTKYRLEIMPSEQDEVGSYRYRITPKITQSGEKLKSKILTVSIQKKPISVKLKQVKGSSLDVVMGDRATISYYAEIKNLNASLISADVNTTDSLFESSLDTDEKNKTMIKLSLKEGSKLQTGEEYPVTLNVKIQKDSGEVLMLRGVKLIPTAVENKVKYRFRNSNDKISESSARPYVESKVETTSHVRIKLASIKDVSTSIPEDAFYVYTSAATGKVRITLHDESKVKVGKVYTFTFALTAGDGTKEAKQKIRVKIVK